MQLLNRQSLRTKAIASSLLVVVVITVFTGLYYPARLRDRTLAENRIRAVNLAEMVALGVGIGIELNALSVVGSTFTWARRNPALFYVQVADETGETLATYEPEGFPLVLLPAPTGALAEVSETEDVVQVVAPILYANRRLGTVWIGVSLDEMNAQLARDRTAGLLVSFLVLILGSGASFLFAGNLVRPIERLREAAGRIRDGDYEASVEIESGDEIGALGVAFNTMTGRLKKALADLDLRAEELRGAEARLQDFLENSPFAIARLSREGKVVSANGACATMLGYESAAALSGLAMEENVFTDPEFFRRLLSHRLNTESHVEFEAVANCRDGTTMTLRGMGRLLSHDRRAVEHVELIMEDVTERKRAEEAMRESAEQFRAVTETAADGIVVLDSEGMTVSWNAGATRIFGYSPIDMLGGSMIHLMPDEFKEAQEQALVDIRTKGGARLIARPIELVGTKKDGTHVPVEVSFSQWKRKEKHFFGLAIRDLTVRKELEERIRQSQKLEAVGQLTSGIAHDFNSLLSIILVNTREMLISLEAGSPVAPEEMQDVVEAAERAADVTGQLLGFGRRATLKLVPTDLRDGVRESEPLLRRMIPARIDLRIETDGEVGMVRADGRSVAQMLQTLATNAQEAMPARGVLSVTCGEWQIDGSDHDRPRSVAPGSYAFISVTDSGTGMDELTQSKIFEPFFTTKPMGENTGAGLGLSAAHGLMTQHDGFIDVRSEVGKGTTVRLCFPRHQADTPVAQAPTESQPSPASSGGETILVVEDEEALRRVTKRVLEKSGYSVIEAENGRAALTAYESHADEIDLVLSDMVMPEMDGLQLARAIRTKKPDARVLIVSGYVDLDTQNVDDLDSSIPVLTKPWEVGDLLGRVREVLGPEDPA